MNPPGPIERQWAYIGLGANLGDPIGAVHSALQAISRLPDTELDVVSSLYRSAPVDAGGPDFVNAVARVGTRLSPVDLLDALQSIEQAHGRQRPYVNAPRTLDLDILLYGDRRLTTPRLTLPHPRLGQRAFVVRPLLELAPDLQVPGLGALSARLPGVQDQRIERLAPPPRAEDVNA